MERIGRYEILRELGRGGFGRVYLANDPLMKCEVAIKVMSNADDPELLARFRDEAAAARKLRHESIVIIYDVGETQGVPYIVMEYLQGMDLQKIREQNQPLSLVEKVRILSQVAAGLQVAHENGVIHRDVKPANIMVLRDGSVKIMDFGIARLTREGATHHTRTGVMVGTLQYIPPEQFEGHAVDPLADLWAFGVIAFQLFSGRNPFEAAETMQVIYNITSLQVPDLHQLNPELPQDLCRVVQRLLMRDRPSRYQTFEDVRVDLNPVLETLEALEANRLVDDARMKAARGDLQGAHQMVRQVLERYPSNLQAKQIRDHIITQIRAKDINRQVEELLKKGDQDLTAGSYEEAANSYRQAHRLSPGSSTVRMRLERAQQLADRERRIREELNEARQRLAAADPAEALRILTGILTDNPDNAEAASLMPAAQKELGRQIDAARADAILYARHLLTQQQFTQAMDVLVANARKNGNHADLQLTMEEVRRAEAAAATQARIESTLAEANEEVRNGEFGAASIILAPLAAEFPAHADIREMLKFVAQEEARLLRVKQQRASLEKPPTPKPVPPVPQQAVDPEARRVTERALEISRQHELRGQMADAVHVLDVALSRYPDAAELVNQRLRLLALKQDRSGRPEAEIPKPPSQRPAPAPPEDHKIDVARRPVADSPPPPPPSRRKVWAGLGAAGVLLSAGLGYFLFIQTPRQPLAPTKTTVDTPPPTSAPVPSAAAPEPKTPEPVEVPTVTPTPPALASLLPLSVNFVYRKGDASNIEQSFKVDRRPLRATVTGPGTWLAANATYSGIPQIRVLRQTGFALRLNLASCASLAPGVYLKTVQVTSNEEKALVRVTLKVEAEKPAVKAEPTPVVVTQPPPQQHQATDPPKASGTPVPPTKLEPYSGRKRGTAIWAGSLATGARLVLGEAGVIEGSGTLTGDDIPPRDVQVDVTFPNGMEVQTLPPTSARRVVIINSSGRPVSQIRLNWSIK